MYEIIFSYYEKSENGYDTSNKKEFKKVLGKTKEVSLEDVANYILSQLSRRDIFIFDTKPYEICPRLIRFKENKDGIILKNKKFSLSGAVVCDVSDFEDQVSVSENIPPIITIHQPKPKEPEKKFLREEIFGLDLDGPSPFKNLTPKKKYRILNETAGGDYVVLNDANMEQRLSAVFFSAETAGIIFEGPVMDGAGTSGTGGAQYMGQIVPDMNMTPLRRG